MSNTINRNGYSGGYKNSRTKLEYDDNDFASRNVNNLTAHGTYDSRRAV